MTSDTFLADALRWRTPDRLPDLVKVLTESLPPINPRLRVRAARLLKRADRWRRTKP